MKIVGADKAVEKIKDSSTVIFPGGCASPSRFYDAFSDRIHAFKSLTVCSGLSLGDYRFLKKGLGRNFRYVTWQAGINLRSLLKRNDEEKISFIPLRLSELTAIVGNKGVIEPDVVVIQTSYPQDDGTVSLGISVGPNLHFIREAKLVIAEFNTNMPVTNGDAKVLLDDIDFALESDKPLATYDTGVCDTTESKIVDNVLSLIPEGATVQLGIGSIPDSVLARLSEIKNTKLYSGMLSSGLTQYLQNSTSPDCVMTGELAGNFELYECCHRNPRVVMKSIEKTHDIINLAKLNKFVSVNSTVEIDLHGQCNGETVGGVQISGVGGSLDYIEAASISVDGFSIIALPSTTRKGDKSRIVTAIGAGDVVTTPRYCVDFIVTEYGVARLKGRSLWERSRALVELAHPKFRDSLAEGTPKKA